MKKMKTGSSYNIFLGSKKEGVLQLEGIQYICTDLQKLSYFSCAKNVVPIDICLRCVCKSYTCIPFFKSQFFNVIQQIKKVSPYYSH